MGIPSKIRSLAALFVFAVLFFSRPTFGMDLSVDERAVNRPEISRSVSEALLDLRNPKTKMLKSHFGHPGFENLGFLYDNCVASMILNSSGHKQEAEEVLDFIVTKFRMPKNWIEANEDCHQQFGIIKLVRVPGGGTVKSIINTVNIGNDSVAGKGMFEYNTTPGPVSFLIYALLSVNPDKYLNDAMNLGNVLLAFQNENGSVRDGDRNPERVYAESQLNALAAFRMLYGVTKMRKWKIAADKSAEWFRANVFDGATGWIDQGIWEGVNRNTAFSSDTYALFFAGPLGGESTPDMLKKMTEDWLKRGLVKITLGLPDKSVRTLVMMDFADAADSGTLRVRNGYHPVGSPERTGGAVLALQKTAVRLWETGDKDTARLYKSIAEILLNQAFQTYYRVPGLKGMLTFYATAQNVCVGPFGSRPGQKQDGWMTPVFYAESKDASGRIAGGSAVGCWPMLAYYGINPYCPGDTYKKNYDLIDRDSASDRSAVRFIENAVAQKTFTEKPSEENLRPLLTVMEPNQYTSRIWDYLNQADRCKKAGDMAAANDFYRKVITEGQAVLSDPEWVRLAKYENTVKQKEIGGLIWYPWGKSYANNDGELLNQVLRYPILNEVSVAVYGLVVANFELGSFEETRHYMEMMMDGFSLHQIAVLDNSGLTPKGLISGFWNALVSWEDSSGRETRDGRLAEIYFSILAGRKTASLKPETIFFEQTSRYHELHERLAFNLKTDDNP